MNPYKTLYKAKLKPIRIFTIINSIKRKSHSNKNSNQIPKLMN